MNNPNNPMSTTMYKPSTNSRSLRTNTKRNIGPSSQMNRLIGSLAGSQFRRSIASKPNSALRQNY